VQEEVVSLTFLEAWRLRGRAPSPGGHEPASSAACGLRFLAGVFAAGGWAPAVAGGGFTHDYSAPSAGPPPWHVYEITPEDAYAVATKEPGGATRWTF
jgi:hypothetical protein